MTKEYQVVEVKITHPSFSWANGRYIIVGEENEDCWRLCSLKDNNIPTTYTYSGKFMISITGKRNCELTGASISFDVENSIKNSKA